jgi:hypothetical protein
MDLPTTTQDLHTGNEPRCFACAHLIEWPYCFAFLSGEGIPQDIRFGKFDHALPYPGDHGIQFTRVDSPYDLSESALKRLMTEYRGQRIMPDSSKVAYRPVLEDIQLPQESAEGEPEIDQAVVATIEPATDESDEDLLAACARGNLTTVKRILDRGAAVDTKDAQGNTALMVACRNCQLEVVRLLLERGADVHARNSYSRRAMDVASDWGYPTIIELLSAYGSKESDPSLF